MGNDDRPSTRGLFGTAREAPGFSRPRLNHGVRWRRNAGCVNLGAYSEHGIGGAQDLPQARELYQKACDGGEMQGCFNLGLAFMKGHGVAKDLRSTKKRSGVDGERCT